ncbi:MAG: 30S ribosomal protein S16 [bacterium]|nr:30S ribosomal protein S16 [bacterium]
MTVRIRLKRMGARKDPMFRLVVADSRFPRDGRFIEEIGYYHPTANPPVLSVKEERALLWLGRGARPSETVKILLSRVGVMEKHRQHRSGDEEP